MAKKVVAKDFKDLYKSFNKDFGYINSRDVIPTDSLVLDTLLGGGIPLGKMIDLSSKEGVGKTLISIELARAVIRNSEKRVLFIDAERSLESDILEGILEDNLGDQFTVLRISDYDSLDHVLQEFAQYDLGLVIIDSLTAVAPPSLFNSEKAISEIAIGESARLQSNFLKKYKCLCDRYNFSMLFINQVRTKIGIGFGQKTITEGSASNALRHYADIRFTLRRVKSYKDSEGQPMSAEVEIVSLKNKLAGNLKAVAYLKYGVGICNEAALAAYLVKGGFIKQAGAFYTISLPGLEPKKVQGMEKCKDFLKEHKELADETVRKSCGMFTEIEVEE